MAEGQGPRLRLQLADAADVIVVQIDALKLLLFLHHRSAEKKRVTQNKSERKPAFKSILMPARTEGACLDGLKQ